MAPSETWRFSLRTLMSAVVIVGGAAALGAEALARNGLITLPLPIWLAFFTVAGLLGLAVMMNSWDFK
jgi:hypothetical protein